MPQHEARKFLRIAMLASTFFIGAALAQAPPATSQTDLSQLTVELMPNASKSLLLDVTAVGERSIVVGERGHILVSDDGNTWRQIANVPTRSTLTAVTSHDQQVWAVGHDGVIVYSGDSGENWTLQRVAPFDPESFDPRNGVPLLDVLFLDANNGIAIGAYALLLRTSDAGKTWTYQPIRSSASGDAESAAAEPEAAIEDESEDESWMFDESELELEQESDPHLNAIARTGDGSLFIVGERGAAFRSSDNGDSWERLQLDYQGSMFGVLAYQDKQVLAFGLRGHAFESSDLGDSWTALTTNTELNLFGGIAWQESGAVLVGANGVILSRAKFGEGFSKSAHPEEAILASGRLFGNDFILSGENGVSSYTLGTDQNKGEQP